MLEMLFMRQIFEGNLTFLFFLVLVNATKRKTIISIDNLSNFIEQNEILFIIYSRMC